MTGAELRRVIADLGLSQLAAARLLGVDGSTVRKWLAARSAVPSVVGRFLVFLARTRIAPDYVHEILGDEITVRKWARRATKGG